VFGVLKPGLNLFCDSRWFTFRGDSASSQETTYQTGFAFREDSGSALEGLPTLFVSLLGYVDSATAQDSSQTIHPHFDSASFQDLLVWVASQLLAFEGGAIYEVATTSVYYLDLEKGKGEDTSSPLSKQKVLDLLGGQERRYFLFVRNPGSPWGWKVYELTEIPEALLKVVSASGEPGTPAPKKLARPKARR